MNNIQVIQMIKMNEKINPKNKLPLSPKKSFGSLKREN